PINHTPPYGVVCNGAFLQRAGQLVHAGHVAPADRGPLDPALRDEPVDGAVRSPALTADVDSELPPARRDRLRGNLQRDAHEALQHLQLGSSLEAGPGLRQHPFVELGDLGLDRDPIRRRRMGANPAKSAVPFTVEELDRIYRATLAAHRLRGPRPEQM